MWLLFLYNSTRGVSMLIDALPKPKIKFIFLYVIFSYSFSLLIIAFMYTSHDHIYSKDMVKNAHLLYI